MRELARLLDRVLNEDPGQRAEGFILVRFRHNEVTRPTYVSTCPDDDSLRMLRLLIGQLEGRITGEKGNA